MHRRRTVKATVALLVVGCLASVTTNAAASPTQLGAESNITSAVGPEIGTVVENASVDDALSRIQRIIADTVGSQDVATSISYDTNTVKVFVAEGLRPRLQLALGALPGPLKLEYVTPKFSVEELKREAERLAGLPGIAWAGPTADFSGIEMGVTDQTVGSKQVSPYPLQVTATDGVVPAARNNDTAPARGGALIINSGQGCTAGIGVSYGGSYGFTTAAHCNAGTWTGGSGSVLGATDAGRVSQEKDIRVVGAPTSSNRVWTGAWNTSSSNIVYRAASNPTDGQRICTSGAISGGRCGSMYVRGINMYITYGDGIVRGPGFWILNETVVDGVQMCAGMEGDSGSPTFNSIADGRLEVRGFLIGIDRLFRTTRCDAKRPDAVITFNNTSSRAFAVNVVEALSAISVVPRTG